LREEERADATAVIEELSRQGHTILYESEDQPIAKRIHKGKCRWVLETMLRHGLIRHILQTYEVTPAINEEWRATQYALRRNVSDEERDLAGILMLNIM